jgi:hypothetical protein
VQPAFAVDVELVLLVVPPQLVLGAAAVGVAQHESTVLAGAAGRPAAARVRLEGAAGAATEAAARSLPTEGAVAAQPQVLLVGVARDRMLACGSRYGFQKGLQLLGG